MSRVNSLEKISKYKFCLNFSVAKYLKKFCEEFCKKMISSPESQCYCQRIFQSLSTLQDNKKTETKMDLCNTLRINRIVVLINSNFLSSFHEIRSLLKSAIMLRITEITYYQDAQISFCIFPISDALKSMIFDYRRKGTLFQGLQTL